MDLIRELNYCCNADIFRIVFAMKTSLPNRDDRTKVSLWMNKIMKNNKTLSDMKARNEFMNTLADTIETGSLKAPFNQEPPRTALKILARQWFGHEESQTKEDETMGMLRFLPAKNGGFLLPKPLPQIGAYCYIAASSQNS